MVGCGSFSSVKQRVGSTHRACFCACATRPRVGPVSALYRLPRAGTEARVCLYRSALYRSALYRSALYRLPRARHLHGGGLQGQPSGPLTRPEYGTRGISHPPKRAGACGRPPIKPTAASVPGGRWGSVVFGWRAPRPPRVVIVLGFCVSNKFSHFRQNTRPTVWWWLWKPGPHTIS